MIYLNDHLAGATAGVELARRMAREHRGSAYGETLESLRKEISQDRQALVRILADLDVPVRRYKTYGAWLGEKAGRMKPNGRLLRRSGLALLVELEAMRLGAQGKLHLEQLTAEDWDRTFKTNAYAYFHLVMAALPHLDKGDSIIATATEEALKGSTTMIDYAASKAAVITFTKSIAPHLAARGVRANIVAPGPTWTVLNVADRHMPTGDLAQVGSETPIGRPAQPEEIAPAYVFLASDADSSFVTGEVLAVTGGETDTR